MASFFGKKHKEAPPQPLTSLSDRVNQMQAMLLAFVAENNLSFSLTPKLIDLAQEMARDPKALDSLSLHPTTASYKMRFGVAKTFAEELSVEMQDSFFSLNIDEAVSANNEKVWLTQINFIFLILFEIEHIVC